VLQIGRQYPSDLSDQQWKLIQDFIPEARTGGRPRKTNVRAVLNAIFYLIRTGCAWRYLPREFPPWPTVYDYYAAWKKDGVLKRMHDFLLCEVREKDERTKAPSVVMIDSQSTKAQFGERRGFDGFKKVRGRKRHILVDTLGLVHGIRISAAHEKDAPPAIEMLDPNSPDYSPTLSRSLNAVYVDGGYKGKFEAKIFTRYGFWPTMRPSTHWKDKKNSRHLTGSNLKPKRCIV
jgi:putative transposase